MHKVLVIARREYLAAVRTKAFLLTMLVVPLLMGGSIVMQVALKDVKDTTVQHFAVIDLSPGGRLFAAIRAAVEQLDVERAAGKAAVPGIEVERVVSPDDLGQGLTALRLELSERVRRGGLQGFVEIGPDVYGQGRGALRFQTNRATIRDFPALVGRVVREQVQDARWREAGMDAAKVRGAMEDLPEVETLGLSTEDKPAGEKLNLAAAFLVPFAVMMLMFMVIMLTATPMMQGVVEEKMQRIAEVLLGSVRPFDLMLGKLLGMTAVSLTISAVYLSGAWWTAQRYRFAPELTPGLVGWFLAYQVLAALMYGSLFTAVGAACTDMKETQTLMWPVMILVMVPLWVLGAVVQEPNGTVVTGLSFFPFATPMLMTARQAVPPGVPWWQPAAGAAIVLLTTLACVWAAGRIFRVGILLQGKGARVADLARWVLRG